MSLTAQEGSLVELARAIRHQAIEECAQVAEDFEKEGRIAAAIRALKDKP